MVADEALGGVPAVLGRGGVAGDVPFDVGGAGYEGDVVEVVDAEGECEFGLAER